MEKIKEIITQNPLFILGIFFLGALTGFGFGDSYGKDSLKPHDTATDISISGPVYEQSISTLQENDFNKEKIQPKDKVEIAQNYDLVYIASKTGTNYYLPWCSGAKKLKEKNIIYFETIQQAENAGYVASASCPELIAEKAKLNS